MGKKSGQRQKTMHGSQNFSFGAAALLSVLILSFCMKETVLSQGRTDDKLRKEYYSAMEKEYYSDMKELLAGKGYANSGITIRWISEEEGERNYTVMIHHRKITQLNDMGKEELRQELMETEFKDAGCTFCYEFLVF